MNKAHLPLILFLLCLNPSFARSRVDSTRIVNDLFRSKEIHCMTVDLGLDRAVYGAAGEIRVSLSRTLIRPYGNGISMHDSDETKSDTTKEKGFFEMIVDEIKAHVSWLQKLSGPGPFICGGIGTSLFSITDDVSCRLTGMYKATLRNDLEYPDAPAGSKTVNAISFQPALEYINGIFVCGALFNVDYFHGDAFNSFFKFSYGPYAAVEFCREIRFGAAGYHYQFATNDFGANANLGNEWILELFFELRLP